MEGRRQRRRTWRRGWGAAPGGRPVAEARAKAAGPVAPGRCGTHVFQPFASRGSIRPFEDGGGNVRGPPGYVPRGGAPCTEGRANAATRRWMVAPWLRPGSWRYGYGVGAAHGRRARCSLCAVSVTGDRRFPSPVAVRSLRRSDPAGGGRAPVATGGTRTGSPADGSDRLTPSAGRRPVRRGVAEPVARADPDRRHGVAVRGAAVRSKRGPALAVRIGRVQDDPKAAEGTPRAPPGREAPAARGDGACSLRAAAGWYTAWAPGTGTSRSARPVSDSVLPTKR